MSKTLNGHLAIAYENGAWSYKVRNFNNPYYSNTLNDDVELVREWERGYNHARAIAIAELRASGKYNDLGIRQN